MPGTSGDVEAVQGGMKPTFPQQAQTAGMSGNHTLDIINTKIKNKESLFSTVLPDQIIINLAGKTKASIINELLDMLAAQGKLLDRDTALKDLLDREQSMSTGILNGIAIPHAKTTAVKELTIAIGIKKSGLDFDSPLDDKSRIIILALTPPDKSKPLYEFLIAITVALNDDTLCSKILAANKPEEVVELLRQYK
jgi:mannitol/fructose-specific phosphotransferase system IIA component (Ntr-type)